MKIYIVELHDYDRDSSVGYFTDNTKAEHCCDYLNRTDPSDYDNFEWMVREYDLNETDYETMNKILDEKENLEIQNSLERIKQEELKELARLKAKYES
jgi:hypothetical protein